jgi:hypothetical protein
MAEIARLHERCVTTGVFRIDASAPFQEKFDSVYVPVPGRPYQKAMTK